MRPRISRLLAILATITIVLSASAASVNAQPPEEVFEGNDQTWVCHDDGFPAKNHCVNKRSKGDTGLIMVFPPDDRGPAEGVSGPQADDRPCPNDPGSPDGTWYEFPPETGQYICHHRP